MTKKSQSRLDRDAKGVEFNDRLKFEGLDKENCWENLTPVYQNAIGLFDKYMELAEMIVNPDVAPYLLDVKKTNNLMRGLSADIVTIRGEVNELYKKHQNKTGVPKNDDEYFEITMLHQDYIILLQHQAQTIMPLVAELDEDLHKALANRELMLAAALAAKHRADRREELGRGNTESMSPMDDAAYQPTQPAESETQ